MCYYDLRVFESCLCKRWGDFRSACVQSTITDDICSRKFPSGREVYNFGACERCQEVDVITKELAKGERKLAQSLIAGGGGQYALEELSSAVMSVYEEILNQRRRERSGNIVESNPFDSGIYVSGEEEDAMLKGFDLLGNFGSQWSDLTLVSKSQNSRRQSRKRAEITHEALPQYQLEDSEPIPNVNEQSMQDIIEDLFADESLMLPAEEDSTTFPINPHDTGSFLQTFESGNETDHEMPINTSDLLDIQSNLSDLRIFKTYARGFRNGLQLHDDNPAAPPSKSASRNTKNIHASRHRFRQVNEKFLTAALAAYKKLKRAAYSDTVSTRFRRFCNNLGELDDILQTGFDTLEKFLDGGIPRSLKEMYSFLHVAYAMSQDGDEMTPKLDEPAFISGISVFKGCLEAESSEQDLFDEVVTVMWDELNHGLSWVKEQKFEASLLAYSATGTTPGQELKDILQWPQEHHSISGRDGEVRVDGRSEWFGLPNQQNLRLKEYTPTWKDLVTGTIFVNVIRFLKSLDNIGVVFIYLCGTFGSTILNSPKPMHNTTNDIPSPQEMELQDSIIEKIITPLKQDRASHIAQILKVAKYTLRAGSLTSIHDFEQYLIGLIKIHQRSRREFLRLVKRILVLCRKCHDGLSLRCRGLNTRGYSEGYIESRIRDEEWWYFTDDNYNGHTGAASASAVTNPKAIPINGKFSGPEFLQRMDKTPLQSPSPSSSESSIPILSSTRKSVDKHNSAKNRQSSLSVSESPTLEPRFLKLKKRRIAPEHKPYICDFPDCEHRDTTEANLKRHQISEHSDESVKNRVYRCDVEGCNAQRTGARAKENIKTHKKVVHGIRSRKGKAP
ncbi:hypothetical protein TWF694_009631 [Orbilia ellipsospora]|uniref:C2H2-type domain-containing protein n=1 Tax=Orbilia ellipsospora TaxID=2528407 RepID=A0AAV9XCS8_9PEZI